jgi:hypothetical protein
MESELAIEIKSVDADKIRSLRHAELRKGQNFSTSNNAGLKKVLK